MNFEDIDSIDDLETVSEEVVWQNFERLAAYIFEKNGFIVSIGTVKTRNRQRRQYDVIARKNGRTLLVECKRWSGGRYRLSALKRAVVQHRERALFYESVTDEDAVPIVITLIEEEIRVFDGVPLVPVHKLNAFISELDRHADDFSFAEFEVEDLPFPEDLPEDRPEGLGRTGMLPGRLVILLFGDYPPQIRSSRPASRSPGRNISGATLRARP